MKFTKKLSLRGKSPVQATSALTQSAAPVSEEAEISSSPTGTPPMQRAGIYDRTKLMMRDAPPVFWSERLKNVWAINAHAYSVSNSTALPLNRPVVKFVSHENRLSGAVAPKDRNPSFKRSVDGYRGIDAGVDDKEVQALFAAARAGDCGAIRLLVMGGVDIEARDGQGRTALNIASQYQQAAAIKTLLAAREMKRLAALGDLPDTQFFRKFSDRQAG